MSRSVQTVRTEGRGKSDTPALAEPTGREIECNAHAQSLLPGSESETMYVWRRADQGERGSGAGDI